MKGTAQAHSPFVVSHVPAPLHTSRTSWPTLSSDLRGNQNSGARRHRRDSCPSDEVASGFFSDFEAIRTEPDWLIATPFLTAATRIQQAKIAQYAMKNTTMRVEAKPKSHMLTSVAFFTNPLLFLVVKA